VLVIGKLDRVLARNVLISSQGLMDTMWNLSRSIMPSAIPAHDSHPGGCRGTRSGMISQRTKAALAVRRPEWYQARDHDAVEAAVIARAAKKLPKPEPEVLDWR